MSADCSRSMSKRYVTRYTAGVTGDVWRDVEKDIGSILEEGREKGRGSRSGRKIGPKNCEDSERVQQFKSQEQIRVGNPQQIDPKIQPRIPPKTINSPVKNH